MQIEPTAKIHVVLLQPIGYVVLFGPNLIAWCFKKKPRVLKSSIESKYRVVTYTVAKTFCIWKLLTNIGIALSTSTHVMCDNIIATYLTVNPNHHDCFKHIVVDYHFVHYHIAASDVVLCYVPTHLQLANVFTKGLSSSYFF